MALGLLVFGSLGAWFYTAPFLLLRLLPEPPFQTVKIEGTRSNGTAIDLGGGWLNNGDLTELLICSTPTDGPWDRPQNITIRNGRIRGSIRIMGLGRSGEAEAVRASSVHPGHTARAQEAAPRRITIENLEIEADYRIPLYLAPGVTEVTVRDCRFTGWSVSTAIYLCAESAENTVIGNVFEVNVGREVIAVDGSARNLIAGNRFMRFPFGGVYLYRNCGEGGTVRHQTPHGNRIESNDFSAGATRWGSYGIWLGSRGGWAVYCGQDAGHPFGSSVDNGDFADDNAVTGNIFADHAARTIRDSGTGNLIEE